MLVKIKDEDGNEYAIDSSEIMIWNGKIATLDDFSEKETSLKNQDVIEKKESLN